MFHRNKSLLSMQIFCRSNRCYPIPESIVYGFMALSMLVDYWTSEERFGGQNSISGKALRTRSVAKKSWGKKQRPRCFTARRWQYSVFSHSNRCDAVKWYKALSYIFWRHPTANYWLPNLSRLYHLSKIIASRTTNSGINYTAKLLNKCSMW